MVRGWLTAAVTTAFVLGSSATVPGVAVSAPLDDLGWPVGSSSFAPEADGSWIDPRSWALHVRMRLAGIELSPVDLRRAADPRSLLRLDDADPLDGAPVGDWRVEPNSTPLLPPTSLRLVDPSRSVDGRMPTATVLAWALRGPFDPEQWIGAVRADAPGHSVSISHHSNGGQLTDISILVESAFPGYARYPWATTAYFFMPTPGDPTMSGVLVESHHRSPVLQELTMYANPLDSLMAAGDRGNRFVRLIHETQ